MAAKTTTLAVALAAGLLALPAAAQDGKVRILRGAATAETVSAVANENGSRVTVLRAVPLATAPQPAATSRRVIIDGLRISVDDLEPAGSTSSGTWFLDRSGSRPVLVHCYTRRIAIVGAGHRLLCDARRL